MISDFINLFNFKKNFDKPTYQVPFFTREPKLKYSTKISDLICGVVCGQNFCDSEMV